jgi:soluble lytic murein transglycosylase-like protein
MSYYDYEYDEVATPFSANQYQQAAPVAYIDPVHVRMFMVLAAVAMVVVSLVYLAKPLQLGETAVVEAGAPQVAAAAAIVAAEDEPPNNPQLATTPADGRSISPVFAREVKHWEPQILAWSDEFGLDPNLAAIIMQIESCGDPHALSSAGARGLFQVMPFHFAAGENSLDPDTNARRGLNYFVERVAQTNGDLGRAFAGYNGGHVAAAGNWSTWARETQRYYTWSTGILNDIEAGLTESPTLQQWMQAGGASLCRQAANRLGLN